MSKGQLIEQIRVANPTATEQFLQQFDDDALRQYLEHLEAAQSHKLRIHGWVRRQPKQRLAS